MRKSVHTRAYKALCERLVAARRKAELTQTELARILGRQQSFVAKYEGGERRIDVIELIEITTALGTDPVRLLRALLNAK
jgi:transcriptional regulator with XRE-family HTH domain